MPCPRLLLVLTPVLLMGCQRNMLVVIAPVPPSPALACRLPPGNPPMLPSGPQDVTVRLHPSPQAMQASMPGCAGLQFRITRDGTPRDVRVLVESPSGYGYGEAATRALLASRYAPRPAETGPHYLIYGATFTPAHPAPSPAVPSPAAPLPAAPAAGGLRT